MFVITSNETTAVGWRDDHAVHEGLPSGAYVRNVKEHPTRDSYAYLIKSDEETKQWAQDAQNEADQVITGELPKEWYLGSSAPAVAVFNNEEYYTTDPGVTSVNGMTGDVDLQTLLEDGTITAGGDLSEDIEVQGNPIGEAEEGEVYPEGTPIEEMLRDLVTEVQPANYTGPNTNLQRDNKNGSWFEHEPGTTLDPSYQLYWDQNDGGQATEWEFRQTGNAITNWTKQKTSPSQTSLNNGASIGPPSFKIGDGTVTAEAEVWHEEGPVKQNNIGEDDPSGQISAGSTTDTIQFVGIRKLFIGKKERGGTVTASFIRDLTFQRLAKTKSYTLTIPDGTPVFVIAIPKPVGDLERVYYIPREQNITHVFHASYTDFDVPGAQNYDTAPYRVYEFKPDSPLSNEKYTVTIS